jgi:hypothetical protein
VICVEGIEAILHEVNLAIFHVDQDGVLLVKLIDFHLGTSSVDPDLGLRQVRRNHLNATVISKPEKNARREEYLGLTVRSGQILSGSQFGTAHRFGRELTAFGGSLPFYVVESPWTGLVRGLPEGSRGQSRQDKYERF